MNILGNMFTKKENKGAIEIYSSFSELFFELLFKMPNKNIMIKKNKHGKLTIKEGYIDYIPNKLKKLDIYDVCHTDCINEKSFELINKIRIKYELCLDEQVKIFAVIIKNCKNNTVNSFSIGKWCD